MTDIYHMVSLARVTLTQMEISLILDIQEHLTYKLSLGAGLPKLTTEVLDSSVLARVAK